MRQKIVDREPIKLRTIFPHTSVLSKPHQLQYGVKNSSFPWKRSFCLGSLTSAWNCVPTKRHMGVSKIPVHVVNMVIIRV